MISGGEDGTLTLVKLCLQIYGEYNMLYPVENDAGWTLFQEGDNGKVACVDVEVTEGKGEQFDVGVMAVKSKRTVTM